MPAGMESNACYECVCAISAHGRYNTLIEYATGNYVQVQRPGPGGNGTVHKPCNVDSVKVVEGHS